jgi:putative phosphoribosyl transferase
MDGIFQDRREAGRRLGAALAARGYGGPELQILGIPRGGLVVAAEVARALHAALDVVIARKIRAPHQPELAIGAVVSGDAQPIVNVHLAAATGATPDYLEREILYQRSEIERRLALYRDDRPPLSLKDRTVIVIDDGIATGYTFRAALEALQRQGPRRLVAAVPVAPEESIALLERLADDVVCLATPEPFLAVGVWYTDFDQTTDEEVVALLRENRDRLASATV